MDAHNVYINKGAGYAWIPNAQLQQMYVVRQSNVTSKREK